MDEVICPRCNGLGTIDGSTQCAARVRPNRPCKHPAVGEADAKVYWSVRGGAPPHWSVLARYCFFHLGRLLHGDPVYAYDGDGIRRRRRVT
jgi:hypothetical protein